MKIDAYPNGNTLTIRSSEDTDRGTVDHRKKVTVVEPEFIVCPNGPVVRGNMDDSTNIICSDAVLSYDSFGTAKSANIATVTTSGVYANGLKYVDDE